MITTNIKFRVPNKWNHEKRMEKQVEHKKLTLIKGTGTRDFIGLKVVSWERSWLVGLTNDL